MWTENEKPRTAIVTGGARGLGRVIALALRAAGYAVTITASRESAELDEIVADAAALPGGAGMLLALVSDASDPASVDEVVGATREKFGGIHAIVNNAGRGMRVVSETFNTSPVHFWDVAPDQWRHIIATNVDGPFLLARAVMPLFLGQGHGRIVNISTSAQTMTRVGYAPYGPSKAALEAMTRSWAADLSDTDITVNLLLPGGASDTDLLPPAAVKRGADGQLLDPAIMGPPALWLCGRESGAYTGARFIARHWNPDLDPDEAAAHAMSDHVVGG